MSEVTEQMIDRAYQAGARWFAEHADGASTGDEWRDFHRAALTAALDALGPVVPLARAQKAEEAARDFAALLGTVHLVEEGPNAGWKEEGGDGWYDDDPVPSPDCAICQALARHPGFLPEES